MAPARGATPCPTTPTSGVGGPAATAGGARQVEETRGSTPPPGPLRRPHTRRARERTTGTFGVVNSDPESLGTGDEEGCSPLYSQPTHWFPYHSGRSSSGERVKVGVGGLDSKRRDSVSPPSTGVRRGGVPMDRSSRKAPRPGTSGPPPSLVLYTPLPDSGYPEGQRSPRN